jgi:hypothetical protein
MRIRHPSRPCDRTASAALLTAPSDPDLHSALRMISTVPPVSTDPMGADVSVNGYNTPDAPWIHIGTTPFPPGTRLPLAQLRWRVSKPGFESIEVSPNTPRDYQFVLPRKGTLRMARMTTP